MARFRTEKRQFILDRCRGKRVLDVGFVDHTYAATRRPDWAHRQIKEVASFLIGLDYEREVVEKLKAEGWNVIAADAQDFDLTKQYPDGFEVIVASEIIEHLVNPGGFLRCLRRHLAPGGVIIITTPHAYGIGFFLEMLVWGQEKMNDDHTMTFSRKNLEWLLKRSGLKEQEFHWLIQDSTWLMSGGARIAAKIFFYLQCFVAALVRPGFAKEMIVVAVKDEGV